MTTQRVWAPLRPTVTPDQVVLALLAGGDDPEKDLGAALLAVHRAGAAACEVVAAAPVPDEVALIRTLAECRGHIALPVAECVSKSIDDPQYAHLLTRDVFDDAEQAALALFRACVAKGVAPPLACQRVGHVFGVPREDLGPYLRLATDPRSNPVALVDAADRALLAHVSKVSRAETEDTRVVISKAPEPERAPRNPAFEARVNRDEEGRFAEEEEQPPDRATRVRRRLGMTGAAPRVGGAPPVEPEPKQARRPRTARTMRRFRGAPAPAPVTGAPVAQVKPATRQVKATGKVRTVAPDRKQQAQIEAKLRQIEPVEPEPAPAPEPDSPISALKPVSDPRYGTYYTIDEELSVSLPVDRGLEFRGRMVGRGDGTEPFVFRMSHLLKAAGQMEAAGSGEAQYAREHAANMVWGDTDDQHEPIVRRIRNDSPEYVDRDLIDRVSAEMATDVFQTDEGPVRRLNPERERYIVDYPDADSDDTLVVEHRPATPGTPVRYVRVDEFVVEGGSSGRREGAGRHVEYEMDLNQAYQLVNRKPQVFFDEKSKAIVNRWTVRRIDEDDVFRISQAARMRNEFGKAVDPERVHNPAFEATVNRDEEGRFAEEERTAPVPQRPRKPRTYRTMRTARGAPVRQVVATPVARQVSTQRSVAQVKALPAAMRARITQGLNAHLAPRQVDPHRALPDLPELHDDRYYHVLDADEMNEIWKLADVTADERVFRLPTSAKAHLLGLDLHTGSSAVAAMRTNVDQAVAMKEGDSRTSPLFKFRLVYDDDEFRLGEKISAAFDTKPSLAQVTIDPPEDDGVVQVWGNRHAIPTQFLVEIEDGTSFDDMLEMVYMGDAQSKDMLLHKADSWPPMPLNTHEEKPFNAKLQRFRLHNVTVSRWRAQRGPSDLPPRSG